MRKTIAVVSTAGALLCGGAGIADAQSTAQNPMSSTPSNLTTSAWLAADEYGSNNDNSTGMWGLAGLLGLFGLLGLRKRHNDSAHAGATGRAADPEPGGTGPLTATNTSATSMGASGKDPGRTPPAG